MSLFQPRAMSLLNSISSRSFSVCKPHLLENAKAGRPSIRAPTRSGVAAYSSRDSMGAADQPTPTPKQREEAHRYADGNGSSRQAAPQRRALFLDGGDAEAEGEARPPPPGSDRSGSRQWPPSSLPPPNDGNRGGREASRSAPRTQHYDNSRAESSRGPPTATSMNEKLRVQKALQRVMTRQPASSGGRDKFEPSRSSGGRDKVDKVEPSRSKVQNIPPPKPQPRRFAGHVEVSDLKPWARFRKHFLQPPNRPDLPQVPAVILVEGITDGRAVQNAVAAPVFLCQGSTMRAGWAQSDLKLLQTLGRGTIIITDPDQEGNAIRAAISEKLPNSLHAFIQVSLATSTQDNSRHASGNIGVEYASPDVLRKGILAARPSFGPGRKEFDLEFLSRFGFVNAWDAIQTPGAKLQRQQLCNALGIGPCTGGSLITILNKYFTKEEIVEAMAQIQPTAAPAGDQPASAE